VVNLWGSARNRDGPGAAIICGGRRQSAFDVFDFSVNDAKRNVYALERGRPSLPYTNGDKLGFFRDGACVLVEPLRRCTPVPCRWPFIIREGV